MSERPSTVFGVLVAIAALLAALVLGGLAALGSAGIVALAATLAGVLTACIFILFELDRLPLSAALLAVLLAASTVSLLRAALTYARQRRVLGRLPLEPVHDGELAEVARVAGVAELFTVRASRPAAFCFGLLRPRVVVTTGLLEQLDPEEQAAVIWHEAHHAQTREPLKCLVALLATQSFFWMPALRDLLHRYLLVKELAADRAAERSTSRSALAGALSAVAGEPGFAGSVGLAERAAARVDRLLDSGTDLPALLTRSRLLASLVAVAGLTVILTTLGSPAGPQGAELDSMLTSMSLHGLPGMAAGFAANLAVVACVLATVRRVRR